MIKARQFIELVFLRCIVLAFRRLRARCAKAVTKVDSTWRAAVQFEVPVGYEDDNGFHYN